MDDWTAAELSAFLTRPVVQVAPRLLGAALWHHTDDGAISVRLTEVEAYAGTEDPGSHAFRGRTPRNAVMFGPAGHLYVYFSYGMHWCANVVTGPDGTASGILLRAGEVVAGRELARRNRGGCGDRDLARGPARLAAALGLTGADYGADLSGPAVRLLPRRRSLPRAAIARGPRVGVAGPGGDGERYAWRFWIADDPTVSPYRPAAPRPRPRPRGIDTTR